MSLSMKTFLSLIPCLEERVLLICLKQAWTGFTPIELTGFPKETPLVNRILLKVRHQDTALEQRVLLIWLHQGHLLNTRIIDLSATRSTLEQHYWFVWTRVDGWTPRIIDGIETLALDQRVLLMELHQDGRSFQTYRIIYFIAPRSSTRVVLIRLH